MALYDTLRDLPLRVERHELTTQERATSSGFDRTTTTVHLHGDGETGLGEDVTYDTEDHERLADYGIELPTGEFTFGEYSTALDGIELFPEPAEREASYNYRRWGVEAAALDLALRQADETLASALGREYDPVRFIASTRLGEPPSTDRIHDILDGYPETEFKLDPTPDWTPAVVDDLAALDCVRTLDLKGQYHGTIVDAEPSPSLYRMVIEAFPDAVIEDPGLTPETRPLIEAVADRVSWDAIIHGMDDVRDLPFEPRWLNIKPSRFGTLESLLETVEWCLAADVTMYGGGQFELDVGRGQLHALASLFYPDAPNDVAPGGYNDPEIPEGLPTSPLSVPDTLRGFRW